jgi:hypothetical protein
MSNARELSARLAALLADERSALAEFLTSLAAFDKRRAWSELGYTSLWVFLHRELRLSKGAAQYRKTAAELVQRVPEIVEPIRDGRLCLTVVVELARAELRRLHITVPRRLLEKLAAARDALSHSMPNATDDEILEAGLDQILSAHAKRKGLVEKPRKVPPPSKSDAVPAHVRRAVWLRAGGRCECRLASGEVCGSPYKLELDHHPIPKARGGPATIENTRLACRFHNVGGAREVFGNAVMDRYTREASGPP